MIPRCICDTGSLASRVMFQNRQLAVRFLTGAWCLACFVLVTAYSSVLIASLTASDKYRPIINSANDLPYKPDIRVTVDKGLFADVIFQVQLNSIIVCHHTSGNLYFVILLM